jgi:hypothetical protein
LEVLADKGYYDAEEIAGFGEIGHRSRCKPAAVSVNSATPWLGEQHRA